MKTRATVLAAVAAVAFVVAGPAAAHNWYWSATSAEYALESSGYAWKTKTARVHINSATCHGYGRYRVGDARRLFQHFRCSTEGQWFDIAAARAAKKAYDEELAKFRAAAAGKDEATRTALYAPVLKAETCYLQIQGGTHYRFRLVMHVETQYLGHVSSLVKTSKALPTPIDRIPGAEDPIECG